MKIVLTTLTTTALTLSLAAVAHAGSGCGTYGVKSADTLPNHGYMKTVMSHGSAYATPARFITAGYDADLDDKYSMDAAAKNDIVDVAVSAGSFNTLVSAVKAAGLVDTLKGEGPFTVFAPSDAAFAKLPKGTLEALLADKDKLTQILTYHVVPGKLDSGKVVASKSLTTAEGSSLAVADIKIAKTDIMASNGVIHVIDEVLIPKS